METDGEHNFLQTSDQKTIRFDKKAIKELSDLTGVNIFP